MEPEVLVDNGTGDPAEVPAGTGGAEGLGTAPKDFGTITFDDKGNVTGGSVGNQTTQSVSRDAGSASRAPARQAVPNKPAAEKPIETPAERQVAALPATDDPEELYRNSYEFILSGDYGTAEEGFRDHISRFPSDPRRPTRISGSARRCSARRSTVTRPKLSCRPTRNIPLPRKRRTCC